MISLSHKTSLIPSNFMEVPVPRQECKRSYSYVLGVPILILDFGIVPKTWYFIFVNHFYSKPQQVVTSMQIHFVYYICKQIQNILYIYPQGKGTDSQ